VTQASPNTSLDEAKRREAVGPALSGIALTTSRWSRRDLPTVGGIGVAGLVIVFASLAAARGLPGLMGAALGLLMLAIAVVDLRHFIIPDGLTFAALVLALANALIRDWGTDLAGIDGAGWALLRGVVVACCFLAIDASYWRLRGRHGLGLGDVKLAGVAGAWLEWTMIPVAIELAALAAIASYLLRSLIKGHAFRATAKLPFGLFFAPAIWFCWTLEVMLFEH